MKIPNRSDRKRKLVWFLQLILILTLSKLSSAAETAKLKVEMPATVHVLEEIQVNISARDKSDALVTNDNRHLYVKISNNGKTLPVQTVSLRDGEGKLSLMLFDQGSSMLQTYDPQNKKLLEYTVFDVLETEGGANETR